MKSGRVLEEAHEVGLGRLLERQYSLRLELEDRLEVQGDLAHQALEGQFPDEQLRGLLILVDLAQGDGAWAISVRLLCRSWRACAFRFRRLLPASSWRWRDRSCTRRRRRPLEDPRAFLQRGP